ncbi:MAG: DUF6776 family protein [Gammaproteobacteria bacterium]|nr:DUF6776 family protein [Gammaproteobacteria bacterium]
MSMKFAIRRKRPWRTALLGLVIAAIVSGGAYYLYQRERVNLDVGLARLEAKRNALHKENESLREQLESLETEKQALQGKIAILERGRQVDAKAYAKVEEHLKKLQGEILALREELAFYRGIVSGDDAKEIAIHAFAVEREGSTDAYRYSLVLTRNMRNGKVISGTVKFSISGEMDGQLKQLDLKDVSSPTVPGLTFEFKHFQRLEGRMRLPRGFVPHRVYVKVHTPGIRPPSLEQAFDWSRAVG